MSKRQEPIGMFKVHENVSFHGTPATIISKKTYCSYCDRFLDEVAYCIKLNDGSLHKVAESELSFPEEAQ